MAYVAAISLQRTITRHLNDSQLARISRSRDILYMASREVDALIRALSKTCHNSWCTCRTCRIRGIRCSSSHRLNALDAQITDAVHKFEDFLELHESNQFFAQSNPSVNSKKKKKKKKKESERYADKGRSIFTFAIDVEGVTKEIDDSVETLKSLKEEYTKEVDRILPPRGEEEDTSSTADAADDVSSSISADFGVKMVGFSKEFAEITNHLLKSKRPYDFCVFSILGSPGSGRTVAATELYFSLLHGEKQYFDCCAWVSVGRNYSFKQVVLSILAQIVPSDVVSELGDEKEMYAGLKGRRYMIVLDDVWDTQIWDSLRSSFPEDNNGSLVLMTTSLKQVAVSANSLYIIPTVVMDDQTVWEIIHYLILHPPGPDGVFDNRCSPELVEAGQKIAKNCGGLVIVVAKVMLLLAKGEKIAELWNNVAADKENPIFMAADEMHEMYIIGQEMQQYLVNEGGDVIVRDWIFSNLNFSVLIQDIKMRIFPKKTFPRMEIMSLLGMAGIGKTNLVREVFQHQPVVNHFDHLVWIKTGPEYESQEIAIEILAEIHPNVDKIDMKRDAELVKDLYTESCDKRFLIVLDDVSDIWPVECLRRSWTDIKGVVMVTTRIARVAQSECDWILKMRLLNEEESWRLFNRMVFGEESCPFKLEEAGRKIVNNCDGLPLLILTVANLVSGVERTPEKWDKVAERESWVFKNALEEISRGLLPSYNCLAHYLKACFLYMGVFRVKDEIPISRIIKLWCVEGLNEECLILWEKENAQKHLSELVDRSLIMVSQMGSNVKIKTCRLHSVFWYLSNSEAMKTKFFQPFDIKADEDAIEDATSQSRLCIRNNILLGIEDVRNVLATASNARSLLCTGAPQQYPVPIYFGLTFLRVLDAFTIRFYEFPREVLKLVWLRYLALTCNEKIPPSISQLWKLQYLIVNRHLRIKFLGDSMYLPVEIWDLKELKHIEIVGSSLPNPNFGAILPYLFTLSKMSAHSCTRGVLDQLIRLESLGIQIELAPQDDGKQFQYLNNVSRLNVLTSLKCVVMNPDFKLDFVVPPAPTSMFPVSLKKLSLSGLGYPWEYMSIIGKLPKLEVLKLRCYAFRGQQWEVIHNDFLALKFLSVEDTDLVQWKFKAPSFQCLECLSIKHCYKLQEITPYFPRNFKMLEVVDCNPSVVSWANQIKENYWLHSISTFQLSSWDV